MRNLLVFALWPLLALAQENTPLRELPRKVVDLAYPLHQRFPNFSGDKQSPLQVEDTTTWEKGGYFSRRYCVHEHFGTHMDAPAHFGRGQATVDRLGPERLFVAAVVLDASAQAAKSPDYALTAAEVLAWEKTYGRISPGAAVLLRTGWGKRASDMAAYRNADAGGVMHFPGFGMDAARLLVEQRGAIAFGIDNLSVDIGRSTNFEVHRYTQARGLYHLENLDNLDRLPARVFLIVAPIKLEGGSGGQVRVWAVLP